MLYVSVDDLIESLMEEFGNKGHDPHPVNFGDVIDSIVEFADTYAVEVGD